MKKFYLSRQKGGSDPPNPPRSATDTIAVFKGPIMKKNHNHHHRDCHVILAECASDFSIDYCIFTQFINYGRRQLGAWSSVSMVFRSLLKYPNLIFWFYDCDFFHDGPLGCIKHRVPIISMTYTHTYTHALPYDKAHSTACLEVTIIKLWIYIASLADESSSLKSYRI